MSQEKERTQGVGAGKRMRPPRRVPRYQTPGTVGRENSGKEKNELGNLKKKN